jgi:dipeptidase
MLLALFAAAANDAAACTSWVIHRGVTKSGKMIVHKVLDQYRRDGKLKAGMLVAPNGWRWMCIGNPNYAMNEKGVVMTTNDGDGIAQHHPGESVKQRFGPAGMNRLVMTSCPTAEQGVAKILEIGRYRLAVQGGIYFIADPKRAFMININCGYAEVSEITDGLVVITNTWQLPGGEEFSTKTINGGRGDRAREANTRSALQQSKIDEKYTVRGSIDTSRRRCGTKFDELYPFRKGEKVQSLSSVCFELDDEFPAYLSCAYIASGPQQHTVYIPTPMALERFPEKFADGSWSRRAFALQDAVGSNHPTLPRMREPEDKFLAEFDAAREQARTMLRDGKTDEAVKLLNELYMHQYAEADKLMNELDGEAAKRTYP